MSQDRTFVGLDVHAWSVVGHALDAVTGEVWQRRLTPDPGDIFEWVSGLPGPVKVVYEAGPTGFGLARDLRSHGIACLVAAPSKLQRPSGTGSRPTPAMQALLARLLKLDEIVEVIVPSPTQEAARDLVRACEDVRGDLMRSRHRVSKFLLRQGIVWTGGQAWTGRHDVWLRSQRFTLTGRQLTFDSTYEAMALTLDRRNRLDAAIVEMAQASEFADLVRRLGCLRGISTLTGFGLAVEVGGLDPVRRQHDRGVPGPGPDRVLLRGFSFAGLDHQDREQPRPPAAGRGGVATTARPTAARARRCAPAGTPPPTAARSRGHQGNQRLLQRWETFPARRKKPVVANVAVARELTGWA